MIRSSMRRYHTYPPHRAPVGALCGPVGTHRAPIGAICEGSSMRLYTAPFVGSKPAFFLFLFLYPTMLHGTELRLYPLHSII